MPAGDRRRVSLLITLSILFCFLVHVASAASAVLGIDLGTEYIKAALVKPGIPLEIVLTKDSKRKESAAVAFKPSNSKGSKSDPGVFPERVYGGDALALAARFPGDVYPNLKPLLGVKISEEGVVDRYREKYPGLSMVQARETNTIGFQSESFSSKEAPFMVEELLAMELKNIKGNAVNLAGKGSVIEDVVITIPPFYTAEEKRAVTFAAELAGLRVLALISDGLAVGLNYATSRTFPVVNEGGKPEHHLVYDMGAGSTTAAVLRFQGKIVKDVGRFNKTIQEVQVLGSGWDKTFGGDALNEIILADMIHEFLGISRMKTLGVQVKHVREHGRTMAKLWKEAERVRHVLSANTETSSSFEGLFYDDVNFKYKLSRNKFEELASAYTTRIQDPIAQALRSAKLAMTEIESVILHGGAVRTPFVQKYLEVIAGSPEKVKTNVNSDEAAVFGAAFKAAGISPSFRVKEIRAVDSAGYPVGISWSSNGKKRLQTLFVSTSQAGVEKQMSFNVATDFDFKLYEELPNDIKQNPDEVPVVTIQTLNLTASINHLHDQYGCSSTDISTKFAIRLNPTNGLPEVTKGWISCDAVVEKKSGVVDGVKDFLRFGSKKTDQAPLQDDKNPDSSASSIHSSTSSLSSPAESQTGDPLPNKEVGSEENPEATKKTQVVPIEYKLVDAELPLFSTENFQRIKDRLSAFDSSDKSRIRREETLNTLEALTYKARDLLEDEGFVEVSTEAQRTEIERQSKQASEWLYGDGADASRETLKARLDELHGLVDPIQRRKEAASQRPKDVKALQEALEQTKAMISLVRGHREAALSVPESTTASEPLDADTTASASTNDDFADLDDETSTATSSTISATPQADPISLYSEEDLTLLTETHESVQSWLTSKLAEQDKLSLSDDPVLLSVDLAAKSKELNAVVMRILQRQIQGPPKPRAIKSKKGTSTAVTFKPNPTEPAAKPEGTPDPVDELLKDMPGMKRVSPEDLLAAMGDQKGSTGAEEQPIKETTKVKTKEKAKPKPKTKPKAKKKSKGKAKDREEL